MQNKRKLKVPRQIYYKLKFQLAPLVEVEQEDEAVEEGEAEVELEIIG